MNTYNQLPGYTPKKARATGWLLVLALLCAAAFVVTHYAPSFYESKSEAVRATRPITITVSLGEAEDLQRHLDNASAAYKEAASAMARSQDWADRALSSLDDIPVTARRLQLARSASQTAQGHIKRAQEELQIAKTVLSERSNKQ